MDEACGDLMATVTLDEESIKRLGEVIADKILYAKNQPEPWITIEELSLKTGRSKNTIYCDVERHGLPCIRRGKKLGFKLTEVEGWLRRR
jgi:excisionase family DNA binding protein